MSNSCASDNYIISLINNVIVVFSGLDFSNSSMITMTENTLEVTQNWVNNINDSVILEDIKNYPLIDTVDLLLVKSEVSNYRLPSIDVIHNMSLSELTEYEALLIDFMDGILYNVNFNVNILLHLKIIQNHFIYKFKIFA